MKKKQLKDIQDEKEFYFNNSIQVYQNGNHVGNIRFNGPKAYYEIEFFGEEIVSPFSSLDECKNYVFSKIDKKSVFFRRISP